MLVKNFASSSMASYIENVITNESMSWYWNDNTTYEYEAALTPKDFQFTHVLYLNGRIQSELFDLARLIIHVFEAKTNIDVKSVIRAKINLMVNSSWTDEELNKIIHLDSDNENSISLVYYVSDSDGDTVLYGHDGTTVVELASPIKGDLIYFKSNTPHRPTPPKDHKRRLVINIVVEV